jgi:hypothetical protein
MDLLNLGDNQFIERMLSSRLISLIETYRIVVNDRTSSITRDSIRVDTHFNSFIYYIEKEMCFNYSFGLKETSSCWNFLFLTANLVI